MTKEQVRKALALRHSESVYGIGADPVLDVNPKDPTETNLSSNQAETGKLSLPWLGDLLVMGRPQLLPWFLVVVSLYAGGTYFYHAVLREDTPRRFRKGVENNAASKNPQFKQSISFSALEHAFDFDYKVRRAFPRVGNQGFESAITKRPPVFTVDYTVPPVSKATARFHDVDYHLPWVLNALVLGVWFLMGVGRCILSLLPLP